MSNTSGNLHQSAKMMQAQAYFQTVVKHELQLLISQNIDRDVAVKQLLHRIVECTETPEEQDIKRVMKQFQMQYDDAVRALIVKQEIGRLKRQGLDAFAAIEELTRKMQGHREDQCTIDGGLVVVEEEGEKREDVEEEERVEMEDRMTTVRRQEEEEEEEEEDGSSPGVMEDEQEEGEENEVTRAISPLHHLSSLSLCQRIDQVTISTSGVLPTVLSTTLESERISPPPPPPSPSLSPSVQTKETTPETAINPVSLPSKKRRAISSPTQSVPPVLRRKGTTSLSVNSSRTTSHSRNQRHHVNKPRSPTFEFPKLKKQKIWSHSMDPPASPTAISSNDTVVDVEDGLDAPREALEKVEGVPGRSSSHRRTLKRPLPHVSVLSFEDETSDPVVKVHGTKRHKPSS